MTEYQDNEELLRYRHFSDSRLKDISPHCVGGCVAKSVSVDEEKLHFFNTVSIQHMEIPIYQESPFMHVYGGLGYPKIEPNLLGPVLPCDAPQKSRSPRRPQK